jgi:hypothetical protein
MNELLKRYPNALEQLEILKKDYLGVDILDSDAILYV